MCTLIRLGTARRALPFSGTLNDRMTTKDCLGLNLRVDTEIDIGVYAHRPCPQCRSWNISLGHKNIESFTSFWIECLNCRRRSSCCTDLPELLLMWHNYDQWVQYYPLHKRVWVWIVMHPKIVSIYMFILIDMLTRLLGERSVISRVFGL